MTFINTLSEELAHAYMESRLDEALSHRTALRARPGSRIRSRRAGVPDHYTPYLIAQKGASR